MNQQLLRRAWDALDSFKQAYPENWHEDDQQVMDDLLKADLTKQEQVEKPFYKVEGPLHVVCQCDKCKAKQEQGAPVAKHSVDGGHIVYPTPQPAQKPWVGLTDAEYLEAESVVWVTINLDSDEKEANREFYKAIEAKLKEKNNV